MNTSRSEAESIRRACLIGQRQQLRKLAIYSAQKLCHCLRSLLPQKTVDGAKRAVYLEASGKQYVVDEGEKVHGVWYLPPEGRIGPDAVVDADPDPF